MKPGKVAHPELAMPAKGMWSQSFRQAITCRACLVHLKGTLAKASLPDRDSVRLDLDYLEDTRTLSKTAFFSASSSLLYCAPGPMIWICQYSPPLAKTRE